MPLVWREQMSVGNDLIDQDHRYLLCLVNSIELALQHPERDELLPVYLGQLVEYTRFHFEREEGIQKKVQFPQMDGHRKAHEHIIEQLQDMQEDLRRFLEHARSEDVVDVELETRVRDRLSGLAREWILDHILKEDKRMEYYLRKVPRNFA